MKRAFSNFFGGKKDKDKDKTVDASSDERPSASTAGSDSSSVSSARQRQQQQQQQAGRDADGTGQNPSRQQQKHRDKSHKHHKLQKSTSTLSGSGSGQKPQTSAGARDAELEPVEQQQPKQERQKNGGELSRDNSLQQEPSQQQHKTGADLAFDSSRDDFKEHAQQQQQQQQQQQRQPTETSAECLHLQQIASLQSHILELESAIESAGFQTSPSAPGSEIDISSESAPSGPASGGPVSSGPQPPRPDVAELDAERSEASKCPACGLPPSSTWQLRRAAREDADSAEKAVQTETVGAGPRCAACGAGTAGDPALGESRADQEPGEMTQPAGTELGKDSSAESGPESSADSCAESSSESRPAAGPGPSPEPGDLSSEIARLASIQQQLQHPPRPRAEGSAPGSDSLPQSPPDSLVSQVTAQVQTEVSHDQLTRELEELAEKYEQLKKTSAALEEQKNELEEAENDARLMVQRQEVQIFTAGEVERMLSSELAEEQERCSQLQRQLNSVRLKHQAALRARQADSDAAGSQATQLVNTLQQELEEVRRQLRLAQRQGDHQKVAHEGGQNVSVVVVGSLPVGQASPEPGGADEPRREECVSPILTAGHADKSSTFSDSGVGEELSHASDVTVTSGLTSPGMTSPRGLPGTAQCRSPLDDARPESQLSVAEEPLRCVRCSSELGCLSTTASAGNSLLTIAGGDQERYLAAALQLLELQRGGPAGGREEPPPAAEEAPANQSLTRQVALLQTELGAQLGSFEETRLALVQQHEQQLQSLQGEQAELRQQLAAARQLQAELSAELQLGGEDEPAAVLLQTVRDTHRREQQLAAQCADLEKKEGAYRETLEEADRIMHSVEMRYQKNIEELENQLRESKNRINFMEGTEEKLKQALYTGSGKRDQQRVAELLDKLIETENEDLKLKEKVYRLERREREQSIRLREEQRSAEQLRMELRDQEELLRELDAARSQVAAAAEQPAALAALQQRTVELQRSEQQLLGRVEELEQAELTLQEKLKTDAEEHALRERRLGEQVDCRQSELESLQAALVEMQLQDVAGTEERAQLRRELQQALRQLEQHQQQHQKGRGEQESGSSATSDAKTDQHKEEVSKLRNQLTQANQKITEGDSYSYQLRSQLDKLQSEHVELQQLADCQKTRAEQDLLQLNLELSQRDEEISSLSAQLKELNKTQMARELDALAEQEGNLIKLLALVKATDDKIKGCDTCRRAADGVLSAVMISLEQVILLISGGSADQSLQAQLRDAEALAAAAARLAPTPRPPGVTTGVQTAPPSPEDPERLSQLQQALDLNQQQLSVSHQELELKAEELEARSCELRLLREQLAQQQRQLRRRLAQQAAQGGAVAEAKDRLLGALLRRLRRVLTPQQAARLAAELREAGDGEGDRQSFDLDVVCQVLQQNSTMRARTPPTEKQSLETADAANTAKLSRIPRLFNKAGETSPADAPPSRKKSPPSKVPLVRRTLPSRVVGSAVAPPVGVARPYRSASSSGLAPVSAPAPAPSARECSPASSSSRNSSRDWSPAPAPGSAPAPAPAPTPSAALTAAPTTAPASTAARDWSSSSRTGRCASTDDSLPPPDDFKIVRAVGGDSLLLYWSPVDDPRIAGYQIFVDSNLQLSIRNPQRTKALLPALDLSVPLQLAIRTVAAGDCFSPLSCAEHRPAKVAAAT